VTPDIGQAYRAMARATAQRAVANGTLKPEPAAALLDVLNEESH
jgi:hypothetical protein